MRTLIENLLNAKRNEETAKMARIEAENALTFAVNNQQVEGTKSLQHDLYKVSVSNKLTRKLDYELYQQLITPLLDAAQFVTLKPEIDLKKLRVAESIYPDIVAKVVTTKPAKPEIKITGKITEVTE